MLISRDALRNISLFVALVGFSLLAIVAFEEYRYNLVNGELGQSRKQVASAEERIDALESQLEIAEEALRQEQARMAAFSQQVAEIAGAVGILERLQGTDRELLQKYSRTYFLSEHYVPTRLSPIQEKYWYNDANGPHLMHTDVKPNLERMMDAAASANIDLKVVSAYRSAYEQSRVNSRYNVIFGRGANQFSAEQGYSEHQLGTTVDFTTPEIGAAFEGLENTKAYEWLSQNAYQYGFVLSYPEGNPYYIFEPWHWRFVGTKLAEYLSNQNLHFYDLEQEEINQYLLYIFDQ